MWDAMNGQVFAVDTVSRKSTSTTVVLNFEPYQSHVIVFSNRTNLAPMFKRGESVLEMGLDSNWRVSFGSGTSTMMDRLHSWSDDQVTRYFSGTATYEDSFGLPPLLLESGKTVELDFGDGMPLAVQSTPNGMQTWYDPPIREAAVVYVNGQRAGSLWSPPYRLDVTRLLKTGEINDLTIVVGNTALNYMAGHRLPDYKLLDLRYGERFQAQDMNKIQVLPSGIIGSPKLISSK